jgi:type I restriction enzyme S subunit
MLSSAPGIHFLACAVQLLTRTAEAGDFLLSVRAPVGELNQAATRTVIGRGLSAIRFSEVNQAFAWHALKWSAVDLNRVAQGSTFVAVSRQDVENLEIPWFESDENRRIAVILDTVDETIEKTEAVIAKLKQVGAGLLHDLLIRGLDEHGQLRPPPAEAPHLYQDSPLGKIPSKWEIVRFRDVSTIQTGDKDTQDKSDDGLYPFYVRSDVVERINSFSFDGEAILTAGDGVGVGKVVHDANGKFDYHQRVYCIHSFADWTCCRFMYYYFKNNFGRRVAKMSAKNSVDSVRMDMISEMLAPCPSFSEQVEIASILRSCEIQIESLCVELSKLHHLKSALMSDLLTGRVRVPADLDFD